MSSKMTGKTAKNSQQAPKQTSSPSSTNTQSTTQQQDEQQGKPLDSTLLKRLLRFLIPYKKQVMLAALLAITTTVLVPLRPYLMKIAVDEKIGTGDAEGLLWMSGLILLLLMGQSALQYSMVILMQWVGQHTIHDVRTNLFRKMQYLSLRYYDTNPLGRLVTRVTSDVEVLNEVFSSGIVMIVADILVITFIVVFMLYTSIELTLVSIIVLPLLFIATNIFRKNVRKAYTEVRKQVARINSFLNEFVTGITVIQLFSQEEAQLEQFDEINTAHTDAQIQSIFYYAVFYPVVELLSTIALALTLWYAAGNILEGTMTIGMIIAFTQYVQMFFRPIRELSDKYNVLQNAMVSSERIFELLDEESFVRDNQEATSMEPLAHSIEFKNIDFAYDGVTPILRDVSFTVNKGETVAIVGATGAGKSSLMNLLCRFYEFQEGDIVIDGRSIRDIKQQSLRSRIAIVLQDVFLFSRTVKENITLNNSDISDQQCIDAAIAVGADSFIRALPQGYDTNVLERGATLSVGQKQLISFARALASSPDILILDEATSNVDTATEQLIEQAINKLLAERTSIVIAHRLSTIQRADKIIVLHKGEVREVGNHQALMKQDGLYAKLYRLQYKEQLTEQTSMSPTTKEDPQLA
jgi:ATP-binding cassette subfamily B protein